MDEDQFYKTQMAENSDVLKAEYDQYEESKRYALAFIIHSLNMIPMAKFATLKKVYQLKLGDVAVMHEYFQLSDLEFAWGWLVEKNLLVPVESVTRELMDTITKSKMKREPGQDQKNTTRYRLLRPPADMQCAMDFVSFGPEKVTALEFIVGAFEIPGLSLDQLLQVHGKLAAHPTAGVNPPFTADDLKFIWNYMAEHKMIELLTDEEVERLPRIRGIAIAVVHEDDCGCEQREEKPPEWPDDLGDHHGR